MPSQKDSNSLTYVSLWSSAAPATCALSIHLHANKQVNPSGAPALVITSPSKGARPVVVVTFKRMKLIDVLNLQIICWLALQSKRKSDGNTRLATSE